MDKNSFNITPLGLCFCGWWRGIGGMSGAFGGDSPHIPGDQGGLLAIGLLYSRRRRYELFLSFFVWLFCVLFLCVLCVELVQVVILFSVDPEFFFACGLSSWDFIVFFKKCFARRIARQL